MPTWRKTGKIWLSVFKQSFILHSPKVVKGFTLNWPLKRSSHTCAPKPTAHTSHCFTNSNIKIMTFFKNFPWICHLLLLSTSVTHNSLPKAPWNQTQISIEIKSKELKVLLKCSSNHKQQSFLGGCMIWENQKFGILFAYLHTRSIIHLKWKQMIQDSNKKSSVSSVHYMSH